jgi:hypothetical protein
MKGSMMEAAVCGKGTEVRWERELEDSGAAGGREADGRLSSRADGREKRSVRRSC